MPRRLRSRPGCEFDELQRVDSEAASELAAAVMRLVVHLKYSRAYVERASGRQVGVAPVEIDEQLVAGRRPALACAGDERGGACVHERQLCVRAR
jgi:hypothetical protein